MTMLAPLSQNWTHLPYPSEENGVERTGTSPFFLTFHSWTESEQIEAIRSWVSSYTIPSTAPFPPDVPLSWYDYAQWRWDHVRPTYLYYLFASAEEVEISAGEPNHKAAAITTRPGYSRSWAIERPFHFKKLLTRSNGPDYRPRIVA